MSETQNQKAWYTSITIISSILAAASGIFGDTVVGEIIADPSAAEAISGAITGIAAMFAIWGRVRASKGIKKKVV